MSGVQLPVHRLEKPGVDDVIGVKDGAGVVAVPVLAAQPFESQERA